MDFINSHDHWAFLEEIEAPMWVDLALEAKSANQVIDDDWFQISHPFHQCSAHELKAAFADSDDRNLSSDFEIERQPSPKIPSSVSRSRGKHYKTKKLRGEDDHFLTQQHPVKALDGASLYRKSGSLKEIKKKSSFINAKQTSTLNTVSVPKNIFTRNAKGNGFRAISSHTGSESSSMTDKAGESNASTITSESYQRSQKKIIEVPSQAAGNASGLLSALRISLRKSCITRQAARVEIDKDKCQSEDCQSSSGKFSVVSSHNTSYDVKISTTALMESKERFPYSRNVGRMTRASKVKVKDSNISKASDVQANFKRGVSNIAKSAHQEVSKSKQVQNESVHAKVALRDKVNGRSSLISTAKDKQKDKINKKDSLINTTKDNQKARMIGVGKENATGRTLGVQNCSSRSIVNGKNRDHKFVGVKGKCSSPVRKKNLTTGAQKVHFR